MAQMVADHEMSLEYLKDLFDATSHRCLITDGENKRLMVAAIGLEFPFFLQLDKSAERMFIAFSAHVKFLEDTEFPERVMHVMELNADKLLVRHSLLDNEYLYFDYHLSYEDGILPQTILNTFFRFNYVVGNTLRDGSPGNKIAAALGKKPLLDIDITSE